MRGGRVGRGRGRLHPPITAASRGVCMLAPWARACRPVPAPARRAPRRRSRRLPPTAATSRPGSTTAGSSATRWLASCLLGSNSSGSSGRAAAMGSKQEEQEERGRLLVVEAVGRVARGCAARMGLRRTTRRECRWRRCWSGRWQGCRWVGTRQVLGRQGEVGRQRHGHFRGGGGPAAAVPRHAQRPMACRATHCLPRATRLCVGSASHGAHGMHASLCLVHAPACMCAGRPWPLSLCVRACMPFVAVPLSPLPRSPSCVHAPPAISHPPAGGE